MGLDRFRSSRARALTSRLTSVSRSHIRMTSDTQASYLQFANGSRKVDHVVHFESFGSDFDSLMKVRYETRTWKNRSRRVVSCFINARACARTQNARRLIISIPFSFRDGMIM